MNSKYRSDTSLSEAVGDESGGGVAPGSTSDERVMQKSTTQRVTLFYKESCPSCQKVLDYIDENGLSDRIVLLDLATDRAAADRLLAISGSSTVPCLMVDGNAVMGSEAILHWLDSNLVQRQADVA